jgi:hypothetical protein
MVLVIAMGELAIENSFVMFASFIFKMDGHRRTR